MVTSTWTSIVCSAGRGRGLLKSGTRISHSKNHSSYRAPSAANGSAANKSRASPRLSTWKMNKISVKSADGPAS